MIRVPEQSRRGIRAGAVPTAETRSPSITTSPVTTWGGFRETTTMPPVRASRPGIPSAPPPVATVTRRLLLAARPRPAGGGRFVHHLPGNRGQDRAQRPLAAVPPATGT